MPSDREFTSEFLAKKVGETIRDLRKREGISQEELAERANIAKNYVGNLERGEHEPSTYVLCRVAVALGIAGSELLKEAGF